MKIFSEWEKSYLGCKLDEFLVNFPLYHRAYQDESKKERTSSSLTPYSVSFISMLCFTNASLFLLEHSILISDNESLLSVLPLSSLSTRMVFLIYFFQTFLADVSIYLSCINIGMAQKLLNNTQVSISRKKMGGKRVAKGMRRYILG